MSFGLAFSITFVGWYFVCFVSMSDTLQHLCRLTVNFDPLVYLACNNKNHLQKSVTMQ